MAVEVTMPQMGADMTEGTLVRWLKQVGEQVQRGDLIAEIETDKATVELEAFEAGTMIKHAVAEGETVPVGEVIALLGSESEMPPAVDRKGPAAQPPLRPLEPGTSAAVQAAEVAAPAQALPTAAPPSQAAPGTNGERLRISPVARRIALEAGLDVRGLKGSGPDGRILRRDVEGALHPPEAAGTPSGPRAAAATGPAPAAVISADGAEKPSPRLPAQTSPAAGTIVPLSRMRQAIARRMSQSKQQQPHYYLTVDVDMTPALAFRDQFNSIASEAGRASINDLLVKASAIALERHRKFNSEFGDSGLVLHPQINIDIGIALDDGLVAPALLDCGRKTLGQIAEASKDLVARAKSGHLHASEWGSGTFTITNLGAYGVEALIGIINPPQAAILGVGSVLERPVVFEGQVAVRQVMKLALSADHRVTDGAEGARFIKEIQVVLEHPASLAL